MKNNPLLKTKLSYYTATIAMSLLMVTPAHAGINAATGFYIGGDLSFGYFNAPSGSSLSSELNGFGDPITSYIRPYLGYRINDYLAVEAAYDDLASDSNRGGEPVLSLWNQNQIIGYYGPDHYRLYGVDFAGKLIYPFAWGLSVFAKAGLAYMHQSAYNQLLVGETPLIDSTVDAILPMVGGGVSYNFTQNVATVLNITFIKGNNTITNTAIAGLGLTYTF